MISTVEEAIALVKSKANGRTRYEGQEPFVDELLVGEIERLRAIVGRVSSAFESEMDGQLANDEREALRACRAESAKGE